jgi:hypothetical protein
VIHEDEVQALREKLKAEHYAAPADTIELEDALEAARGLAELVREEFPSRSLVEIVETWTPAAVTEKQRIAIARLERAGVWPK